MTAGWLADRDARTEVADLFVALATDQTGAATEFDVVAAAAADALRPLDFPLISLRQAAGDLEAAGWHPAFVAVFTNAVSARLS